MGIQIICPRCHKPWEKENSDIETLSDVPGFQKLYLDDLCPSCLKIWKEDMAGIIHKLQVKAGFEPCFGKRTTCDQLGCCFRLLCLCEHHEVKRPVFVEKNRRKKFEDS